MTRLVGPREFNDNGYRYRCVICGGDRRVGEDDWRGTTRHAHHIVDRPAPEWLLDRLGDAARTEYELQELETWSASEFDWGWMRWSLLSILRLHRVTSALREEIHVRTHDADLDDAHVVGQ